MNDNPYDDEILDTVAHALAWVIWHSHDDDNKEQWRSADALGLTDRVRGYIGTWEDDDGN